MIFSQFPRFFFTLLKKILFFVIISRILCFQIPLIFFQIYILLLHYVILKFLLNSAASIQVFLINENNFSSIIILNFIRSCYGKAKDVLHRQLYTQTRSTHFQRYAHTDEEHGQPIRWTDSCCDVPLTFSKLRTSLDDLCPELEREPCLTMFFDCTLSNVNDAHCTGFIEQENRELCFIRASRYSLLLILTDSYESINDTLYRCIR